MLVKSGGSNTYLLLISRWISCVFLFYYFSCASQFLYYLHITKLNFWSGDQTASKNKKLFSTESNLKKAEWNGCVGGRLSSESRYWQKVENGCCEITGADFTRFKSSLGLYFSYGWCTMRRGKSSNWSFPVFFIPLES